ncbi:MAG: DUF3859 domain-containing protein [Rhodospirillaceae bacterium]|nr:DUF3859 domain-containing protein [Rhodospirillaceae bacterium]
MRFSPNPTRLAAVLFAAVLAVAAGAAQAGDRVAIVDYGIYDHVVTEIVKDPKEVAGERSLVANIKVREQTTTIDAQRGRMFGFQFRVNDPALIGKTLTIRKLVPRLTNPKTGRSTTVMEDSVVAQAGVDHLNAYGFDYDWERAEGEWTFQVLHEGKVLAEKKFKVILPMN